MLRTLPVLLLAVLTACAAEREPESLATGRAELGFLHPCIINPSLCEEPTYPTCGTLPGEITYEAWDKVTPLFPADAPEHTALVVANAPDSSRQLVYGIELGRFAEPPIDDRVRFVMSVPEPAQWSAIATIAQQTAVMMPPAEGTTPSRRQVFVSRIALKLPTPPPTPGDHIFHMTVDEVIDAAAAGVYAGMTSGTECAN
jgi:hypothetical protein